MKEALPGVSRLVEDFGVREGCQESMSGLQSKSRIIGMLILFTLAFLGVVGRMFQFQYYLRKVAFDIPVDSHDPIHLAKVKLLPERGDILSRNGAQLAGSLPRDTLVMEKKNFKRAPEKHKKATLSALAKVLGLTEEQVASRIDTTKAVDFNLARCLPEKDRKVITELMSDGKSAGLRLEPNYKRYYPMTQLASNLIGYVDTEGIGQYGIEKEYDKILEGKPITYMTAVDAFSRPLLVEDKVPPQPQKGADIELTIDEFIQSVAEEQIEKVCLESQAKAGYILVMNPNNGEMLAMAQFPRYDPNEYSKGPAEGYRNGSITELFEPGSLAKVFTVYCALAMNQVTPDTIIDCRRPFSVGGKPIADLFSYGDLTVTEILAKSVNVGTVKLAVKCGKEALYQSFSDFGLDKLTKIDLPNERSGSLPHPNAWSATTMAVLPYGYEMTVSSMQMCRAYASVANGGKLVTPHVVKSITDHESGRRMSPRISAPKQVLSEETAKVLATMMTHTIEEGTGRRAKVPGFTNRISAKSGTALQVGKDEEGRTRYMDEKVIASFIGFLPLESPELVIGVHIWHPQEGPTHGGELAGPVFCAVADYAASRLNIARIEDPEEEAAQGKKASPTPTPNKAQIAQVTSTLDYVQQGLMPDLNGMTKGQVHNLLDSLKLEGRFEGSGFACAQAPAAGKPIQTDKTCFVEFNDGETTAQ